MGIGYASLLMAQLRGPALVAAVIILGLVGLVLLILMFQFGWLYIQAAVSGAHVSFVNLIAMRLRRVNATMIVTGRIAAVKAGLSISTAQLPKSWPIPS